jgi:hypothetical protein
MGDLIFTIATTLAVVSVGSIITTLVLIATDKIEV